MGRCRPESPMGWGHGASAALARKSPVMQISDGSSGATQREEALHPVVVVLDVRL
jgi:hypothetical protein